MTTVALALAAALCFAGSSVLQHAAASSPAAPCGGAAALRLVGHLLGRPLWLLGGLVGAAGLALHALALRGGQIVLVQPLLASGLVLALLLGALSERTPPGAAQWRAAGCTGAGLAVFLLTARPAAGAATGRAGVLAAGTAGALALAAGARLAARRGRTRHPALLLGAAAGAGFGVGGVLLKQVVGTPVGQLAQTWPPYALLVVGAVAVSFAQWAYQAGPLVECLPTMTVLEPLVAVALGSAGFGEALARSPAARLGQVAGLVLLTGGVVRLAALQARDRAPVSGR